MEEQMLLVNMHLYPKAYVCMYVCLIINWLSIGLCQLTKTDQLSSIEQLSFLIIISSTVHDLIILFFVYIKPSHHQGLEPLYLSYFTLSSINWMKWNFKKILYVHVLWQTTCLVDLICSALLKALKTQDVSFFCFKTYFLPMFKAFYVIFITLFLFWWLLQAYSKPTFPWANRNLHTFKRLCHDYVISV